MTDNDPITLADAAQRFGFTVWTLRSEADKGRLTIYRIGKRDYTTPNDIREMVCKCRVAKKGRPRRVSGGSRLRNIGHDDEGFLLPVD